ncbi:sensor histidine kinase [Deinococcus yavapaiensis]|uniref:histidine kinase n=1 Tax=Deinococcus yavapaiensis KR-236 TaxID=694435 RepID=A0A318SG54_9DEIO|nr:HAMP domain-containing sensor histidine kinase [Deinococcus yavapaiensis]PYE48406.1 signal transduction histidine kinase [Deinococcus yavapaiensis KR-236]
MTLRFRLALVYSLVALVLLAVLAGTGTFLLTSEVEKQFVSRLEDQAEYVRNLFTGDAPLGIERPSGGALVYLFGQNGFISASQNLGSFQPVIREGQQVLDNGTSVYGIVRPVLGDVRVWVALPYEPVLSIQRSAWQFLLLGLLVAPVLMLLIGWLVGRYYLRGLASAARVAERLDPSAGSIPLPSRQDEVYRLLEAINRLLGRISTQQQREKALLGQIVHELGAPLTVLRASLARASLSTESEEVRRAALVAEELSFTTQDLMQLARGQMDITLALHFLPAANLRDRLDRLVPSVRYEGDWSIMVLCDPDRLVQALRNLLANARRAAGRSGRVELRLLETPTELRFIVRDDGPGLPAELGERIFEPFVSGSGSSGLGLSVSRQIAELHGGTLTGGNHAGGGAEFLLILPSATVGDEDDADDDLDDFSASRDAVAESKFSA